VGGTAGARADGGAADATAPRGDGGGSSMSFFITSTGTGMMGGNLGGLAGADDKCKMLATAVGAGNRTWRAYLSTTAMGGQAAVNARDRIGKGPWFNVKGVMIAPSIEALHDPMMNMISLANGLDEKGNMIPTSEHDIMTGSTPDGMVVANGTCANWTSNGTAAMGRVGHFNRAGGGEIPTSWNSAHLTPNCTPESIKQVAGAARTYCFAAD
jgi:hypothetical protein